MEAEDRPVHPWPLPSPLGRASAGVRAGISGFVARSSGSRSWPGMTRVDGQRLSAALKPRPARRKTFRHRGVGPITLDCDALAVQGRDLNVIVYTAPAGSDDAASLALLAAVGLQSLSAA